MQQTTTQDYDVTIWKPHIANFAPLSEAFIAHIFEHWNAIRLPSYGGRQEPPPLFDQIWQQIQQVRKSVSRLLSVAITAENVTSEDRITPNWFRRNFAVYAGTDARLPRTTVQEWTNKHLLRSIKHGRLEPNSVAAVYMIRDLFRPEKPDEQKVYKQWKPKYQSPDDPWFYVWGIGPDEKIPRMYPYPLRECANRMYWTHWLGASWRVPGWVSVPGVGSLAWGKIVQHASGWYWDMSEEDMSQWDASFVRSLSVKQRQAMLAPILQKHPQGLGDAEDHYRITRMHRMAQVLLEQLGEPILAGHMLHYFQNDRPPNKPYLPF